ncbi:MAG: hypothetical protein E4H14_00965 [Candidatus Thorarchaeota archaeon]|nr:MAG: hypothetical protein E4H14_00965 [Candidatus Thorarchaeota archaeon]
MSDEIMERKYEFFSVQGFLVGAILITSSLVLQSLISFPEIWQTRAFGYVLLVVCSALVVGVTSGGVLVYLYPPDQDVIGIAGMGSDDSTQHLSLVLVILSLAGPIFFGFSFFYQQFANDVFIFIWVIASFAAPSLGLTIAMLDRSKDIEDDLRVYFTVHKKLDMASLDWLHGLGPRTATYRMGMLESAAKRIDGLRLSGHEIVKENETVAINP